MKQFLALGRLKTGEMNKTEAAYDSLLRERQGLGFIVWYKFEPIKLRLADNTFYTADFAVLANDLVLELHEVKGFGRTTPASRSRLPRHSIPSVSSQSRHAPRRMAAAGIGRSSDEQQ